MRSNLLLTTQFASLVRPLSQLDTTSCFFLFFFSASFKSEHGRLLVCSPENSVKHLVKSFSPCNYNLSFGKKKASWATSYYWIWLWPSRDPVVTKAVLPNSSKLLELLFCFLLVSPPLALAREVCVPVLVQSVKELSFCCVFHLALWALWSTLQLWEWFWMQVNTELYLLLVLLLVGVVIVLSCLSHSIMDRLMQGNIFLCGKPIFPSHPEPFPASG